MNSVYQISLIVPALNESKNIVAAVKNIQDSLLALNIKGQVVVVDDGSSDNTGVLAQELAKQFSNISVIQNPTNLGIGYSFWAGVQAATGDVVVMLPGDGENDASEILRYLPLLSQVDIVIPYVYNVASRSLYRRLLSKLYKAIINITFGLLLNYMNGTVMYRRSVLLSLSLRSTGFFYQTELLIKAIRAGYLYAEVPYAIKLRTSGNSKAVTLRSLFKVIRDYSRTVFSVFCEKLEVKVSPASATAMRYKDSKITAAEAETAAKFVLSDSQLTKN